MGAGHVMTALALSLLAKLWPYLIGGSGLLFAAWKLRRSGAQAERAKQAKAEQKAREVADQVDNDIGAMPPDQAREALKRWAKR